MLQDSPSSGTQPFPTRYFQDMALAVGTLPHRWENSGKGWWMSTLLQGLQGARKLAGKKPLASLGSMAGERHPGGQDTTGSFAGRSGEPGSEPRAVPGCRTCRPGCSDVPAPSERARARSPSLPGHRAPSRLSAAPVAWQPCVWEGGQPQGEHWVAVLPQSAGPHQPSSPLLLFRGAFW